MVYGTLCLAIQMTVGFIEGSFHFLCVRQQLALLLQFFLLTANQLCLSEFLKLKLYEFSLLTVALYLFLHLLQLTIGCLQLAVFFLVFFQQGVVVGYDVHHAQLEVLLVQQQVLVL